MSRILIKLRDVPEDEIKEILELLQTHRIEYYETDAGNWGISMPALWVQDEQDYPQARELLDDYQSERQQRMREEWNNQRADGTQPTFLQTLTQRPLITLGLLAFCAVLMWFSIRPFLTMLD